MRPRCPRTRPSASSSSSSPPPCSTPASSTAGRSARLATGTPSWRRRCRRGWPARCRSGCGPASSPAGGCWHTFELFDRSRRLDGQGTLMKTLAILVGGGPAPGINAVIAAATIEARNHGLRVLGCYDGFKWLVQGDTERVVDLEINDTSRIHFDGGSIIRTSRTNPSKSAEAIHQVGDALQRLGVNQLITIGGDDTAYSASRLAKTVPGLTVAHVPKTIDNDLPLPGDIVTFGFTTACNLGKELVRNLMQDAQTTERWFFVTVMGRHAGHLALGIGGSAAATLTLIAEEFSEPQIP